MGEVPDSQHVIPPSSNHRAQNVVCASRVAL